MQTPGQSRQEKVFPPVASLVPHSASMLLLDRVVDADADSLQAEVDITATALFCGEDGVGSWIGIEYMAQAVAAFAGVQAMQQARKQGLQDGGAHEQAPRKIGFLLGSRRYTASRGHFAPGSTLRIHVQRLLQADNGLGSFDCSIAEGGERIASATLTVFQPPDLTAFLDEGAV
ncbi:3-hydroxylacyl-ACP dehydratase [Oxalobacteraceae bacterium CAVE-383]|nr:3-hydroxylacyl-ACP dehydratase [Oxalobacteraceae bacterium CAVE-383]